jgi:hypothetical protein
MNALQRGGVMNGGVTDRIGPTGIHSIAG